MSEAYTIGTLTGQTSGTLTGRDYGTDLGAINTNLTTVNTNLQLLTAQVTTLNTVLHANNNAPAAGTGLLQNLFGAGAIPGTIPSQMVAEGRQMQAQTDHLGRMANNVGTVGVALQEKTNDFAQIASQFAIFNASAQIFIAQMARKQAFEVAATNAALDRAGLPEVQPTQASVDETMTTAVTDAVTVGTQAKVSGFINEQISNATGFATDLATDYIQSTALGGFVAEKFTQLRGLFQTADPEATADEATETQADTETTTRNV